MPLTSPASILYDNQGAAKNTSLPASILNKKHYAITYYSVHEAMTAVILRVGKEDSLTNLTDPFIEPLPRKRRYELFSNTTYSSQYNISMSVPSIPDSKHPGLIT